MRAQMFGVALRGGRGANGTVTIGNEGLVDSRESPDTASVIYRLGNDGTIQSITTLGGTVQIGTWLVGSASYSNYEVQFTVGGVAGGWLALSTSRSTSATRASVGTTTKVVTVQIRDAAAPNTVRDTATVQLVAEVAIA